MTNQPTDTHSENVDESIPDSGRRALINTSLEVDWSNYYDILTSLPANFELAQSLKLLNIADQLMNQTQTDKENNFAESSLVERFLIGGINDSQTQKNYPFDTELLGSMQGFASFKKVLRNDPKGIAKLLKVIPANGRIDGWHFMQFIDSYKSLFLDNGFKQTHLFPATRLLTMKRPDHFLTLTPSTAATICRAFDVKPLKKQDFQRYWDDIILPIQNTKWFAYEHPDEAAHLPIHRARVALFERIICTPSDRYVQIDDQNQDSPIDSNSSKIQNASDSNVTVAKDDNQEPQSSGLSNYVSTEQKEPLQKTKKSIAQPKKLTIAKKKSAKVNKNAAVKLMSQYYFANKEKYSKVDMAASRDKIIDRLIDGDSVETAFDDVFQSNNK